MSENKQHRGPDLVHQIGMHLADALAKYAQVILAVATVAILAGGAWALYNWRSGVTEEKAQAALYHVEKEYLRKKDEFSQAEMTKALAKDKKEAKSELKSASGDLQQDFGPEVKGLEDVIAQFGSSRAAVLAALDLADLLAQYKQIPQALATLGKVEKNLATKELLTGALWMKRAALQSVNGDQAQAIADYEKVLKSPRHSHFHAEASLRSGVCLEAMKDVERAKQMYRETSEKFPDTSASQTAQKYLQLLEAGQS